MGKEEGGREGEKEWCVCVCGERGGGRGCRKEYKMV